MKMSMTPEKLGKPLKVHKRIQETQEAVTLVLDIPEDLRAQFRYQAGQFVTFFLNVDGKPLNRSYSLCTSPLVDSDFRVTVKRVKGGRGSTFLCDRVSEGDVLMTSPPAGLFFKPALDPEGVHYLLFAAGSGITPVISIMKTVLTASPMNRVTLVYGNRDESSIIYRSEIDNWIAKCPDRLKVLHVLSRPSADWQGRRGRIGHEIVAEAAGRRPPQSGTRQAYMCGPREFMDSIRVSLRATGLTDDLIREEDFAVDLHKPGVEVSDSWTLIGQPGPAESPETIIARINGEEFTVPAKAGQSILETLLESGAQPPYSCMDGACMACLAKIQEGRVYQEDLGILTEDNVAAGEALTCQAKPVSRIVKVSYDDL